MNYSYLKPFLTENVYDIKYIVEEEIEKKSNNRITNYLYFLHRHFFRFWFQFQFSVCIIKRILNK